MAGLSLCYSACASASFLLPLLRNIVRASLCLAGVHGLPIECCLAIAEAAAQTPSLPQSLENQYFAVHWDAGSSVPTPPPPWSVPVTASLRTCVQPCPLRGTLTPASDHPPSRKERRKNRSSPDSRESRSCTPTPSAGLRASVCLS